MADTSRLHPPELCRVCCRARRRRHRRCLTSSCGTRRPRWWRCSRPRRAQAALRLRRRRARRRRACGRCAHSGGTSRTRLAAVVTWEHPRSARSPWPCETSCESPQTYTVHRTGVKVNLISPCLYATLHGPTIRYAGSCTWGCTALPYSKGLWSERESLGTTVLSPLVPCVVIYIRYHPRAQPSWLN